MDRKQNLYYSTLLNTNRQLVKKIHELSIVRRINDSLQYVPDIKKVCCSILNTIKDEINVLYCSIMILDNKQNCLILKALWSPVENKAIFYETDSPHYHFKLDEGVAGKVAKEGVPILISDVTIDERFVSINNFKNHIKSLLCMPLKAGDEIVGVINLSHHNANAFGSEEEHLLTMITNQIAIALKNVHLFHEMEEINKTLEEKVRQRTKKLENINKTLIKTRDQLIHSEKMAALGTLAGGVAHEFNNLLCMMQGYAELAVQKSDLSTCNKALKVVLNASERAKTIAQNLLSFSKRSKSKIDYADLREAMEETLALIERDIEKDNIKIARKYEEVPKLICDISLLQQVFLNLIINSRHAMRNKGGVLTINIRLEGEYIVITIADTGHGIKKELQKKIFEPFFTTKGVWGSDEVPGTGLGLSVSMGVIESHGGKLEVQSDYGKGAMFTIKLPVDSPYKNDLVQHQGDVIIDSTKKTKKADILIVDDEDAIRELLAEMLKISGHKVFSVSDGEKAVDLCESKKFDIVFMDIMMPGISGVESVKKIKVADGKPRIVFITGLNIDDKDKDKIELPGHSFVKKPFKFSEINQIVNRLLNNGSSLV